MDQKRFTSGIFLDLKKAFDTVNHLMLLQKLNRDGIRGIINDWFASYRLSGRSQVTEVGFNLSTECMTSFVSHRGLYLVLCYSCSINSHSFSLLYANTNLKSREKTVNSELLKVSDWLNANKLMLSAKRQTICYLSSIST